MADKDTVTMYPPGGQGEPVEVLATQVETMKGRGWTVDDPSPSPGGNREQQET